MRTTRLVLATAVAAFFAIFAISSPAQAYPGVTVTVTDTELVGGNDTTITATVDPAINCAWTFTYGGQTKTGSGSSITSTFHTPVVPSRTETTSTATCAYDSGGGQTLAAGSATGTGQVVLLPLGDSNGDGDADGGNTVGGDTDGGNTVGGDTVGGNADGTAVIGGGSGGGGLSGLLPNTGGERLAWLVIGGLLVLVGGGAIVATRRRA